MKAKITKFGELKIDICPYDRGTLRDVTWTPYDEGDEYNKSGDNGFITGTVVDGASYNRLFGTVRRTPWKVGEKKTFQFCPITRIHNGLYRSHSV